MLDELLVSVSQSELERARAHAARLHALQDQRSAQPTARRLQSALRELYGARRPSADPALFGRFAWAGLDRD